MVLIYHFLMTDKGIKTNVFGKDIFFKFIVPPVLKEIHSSKEVTILTDINERGIYRTERSLSYLKTEMLLVNQLTKNDKKKDKQDKETEIRIFYLSFFFNLLFFLSPSHLHFCLRPLFMSFTTSFHLYLHIDLDTQL